ncbi:MAG: alpha/beta hydrolase [Alphaproteobacteria bacterium]|nr:alpha/beta hydrolase [Alphaproteobacteria bacterium]
MITEEIAHINGIPKKLIVFLHGYQDCAEHIDRKTELFRNIPDVAFHIPQSPFFSEIDPVKRQWFSLHQYDPNDERRRTAFWDDYVGFYNRMTLGLAEANSHISEYIDNLLGEYGLGYEDVFLCGFSQGSMCAAYSGLMCPYKMGGVVCFSGILAAQGFIINHYKSRPDFLLVHGTQDDKVRFDAMSFSEQNLKKLQCHVETLEVQNGMHKIVPEGVEAAIRFIQTRIND